MTFFDENKNENTDFILRKEIESFLDEYSMEDIDISLRNDEFNYVNFKLPSEAFFEIEEFLNDLETKNIDKYYIITTVMCYLSSPEFKKYYIPYARLNDFLYYINNPETDEQVISIVQARQEE